MNLHILSDISDSQQYPFNLGLMRNEWGIHVSRFWNFIIFNCGFIFKRDLRISAYRNHEVRILKKNCSGLKNDDLFNIINQQGGLGGLSRPPPCIREIYGFPEMFGPQWMLSPLGPKIFVLKLKYPDYGKMKQFQGLKNFGDFSNFSHFSHFSHFSVYNSMIYKIVKINKLRSLCNWSTNWVYVIYKYMLHDEGV